MKYLLLGAVALAALTSQAQATILQTQTLPSGGFTSPTPYSKTGTVYTGLTASSDGVYRSPFDTVPSFASAPFTSIQDYASATFNSSGNVLSLIWGSPDSYNKLTLYSGVDGTGAALATINGNQITPANGTGYSYVTLKDFGNFASFTLDNTGGTTPYRNAFEVSTFSVSSVPLPPALPMFGGAVLALAAFGHVMRSRKVAAAPSA